MNITCLLFGLWCNFDNCFAFVPKENISAYQVALVIKNTSGKSGTTSKIYVPSDQLTSRDWLVVREHFEPCK